MEVDKISSRSTWGGDRKSSSHMVILEDEWIFSCRTAEIEHSRGQLKTVQDVLNIVPERPYKTMLRNVDSEVPLSLSKGPGASYLSSWCLSLCICNCI